MAPYADELQVTLEVIRDAGAEVMKLYSSFSKIEDAPADISTDADKASQEIILKRLHQAFPQDALRGEESTPTLAAGGKDSARLWIIDPIDGTRGFARKNDEFSLMIGLVEDGSVVLGAVLEPAIDRLTYAVRGQGCFVLNSTSEGAKPCQVTQTMVMASAVLSISRSQKAEGEKRLLDGFGAARAIQTYSAGIKLAQVARGDTDMYLGDYLTLKDWDVCAGHILVEEAGGKITNIHGQPIRYDGTGKSLRGQGILATNGHLHREALAVLADGRYTF